MWEYLFRDEMMEKKKMCRSGPLCKSDLDHVSKFQVKNRKNRVANRDTPTFPQLTCVLYRNLYEAVTLDTKRGEPCNYHPRSCDAPGYVHIKFQLDP